MSQADSAYTRSRWILPAGLALRRRQFVTGGAAALAAAITASRAGSVPVPEAPDPILDAIEGHRRDYEELGRLLAEQDAAERDLRRARKDAVRLPTKTIRPPCGSRGAIRLAGRSATSTSNRYVSALL
jgi:hypothetical protein